ncbi:hypothetical protein LCGC14_1957280, partial [marine sediment metagenome]
EIYCLILGEGITSRSLDDNKSKLDLLKKNAIQAQKILGIKEIFFENFSDNRFDEKPLLDIVKKVEEHVYNIKPDIIFVAGWRYKIPKEQYSIPSKGCIVFHDSLLPKYRGFAPMNWAIINGEKQIGATMFYIADEIDSGDVITQRSVDVELLDTAESLEKAIAKFYTDMLEGILLVIESGQVNRRPQDHSKATYTCKRTPEDGLIDWRQSSMQIYNLIRGLSYPYPNAFTYLNGKKIYIGKAKLNESKNYVGRIAGKVVAIVEGKWIEVLTGDGSLIVKTDGLIKSIKTTLGRS